MIDNMPDRITRCPSSCSCRGLADVTELEVEPVSVADAIVAVNPLHPDTAKWWAELADPELAELPPFYTHAGLTTSTELQARDHEADDR